MVSNPKDFNQIDKRWVDKYVELWNIPQEIVSTFKRYTGEIPPTIKNPRDKRLMFVDEFSQTEQKSFVNCLNSNKSLLIFDVLKGRGQFAAEWMLVIQKVKENARWVLKPMNFCLNFFGNEAIQIIKQGNIKIGKITIQRKGSDGGRETSKMLQFKINPAELFE